MKNNAHFEVEKFIIFQEIGVEEHDGEVRLAKVQPEVEIWPYRACAMKNMQYNATLWPNRRNFRTLKKLGSRNTIMTSDFRPEVEIWPFHELKYAI